MKKLLTFSLVLAMVFSMAACSCDHQWQEATCTAPKTCCTVVLPIVWPSGAA